MEQATLTVDNMTTLVNQESSAIDETSQTINDTAQAVDEAEAMHQDVLDQVDVAGRERVAASSDNVKDSAQTEELYLLNLRMQQLTSNYIIVKTILNHLDWRDQLNCAQVCRLWCDSAKAIQRENLHSYDFTVQRARLTPHASVHVSRTPVQTPPLFVVAVYNAAALGTKFTCSDFSPPPCNPPCANKHTMLEAVQRRLLGGRACLLGVYVGRLIYMPLAASRTAPFTVHGNLKSSVPFLAGLYLPHIPNVNYHTVQYRTKRTVQEDVFSVVDAICVTDIIKGVIVFVEEQFLLDDNENLGFLTYFKTKQPNTAFAMGGCVVELAACGEGEVTVTMGVFTVPREPHRLPGAPCHFHMYSLVIESSVFKKAAVQAVIQEFAESTPALQYSTALKLSCIGRERAHSMEQVVFRASFPRTALVGCYGNGEIGCNHPELRPPASGKRAKRLDDGEPDYSYSYSTVFVYFGWGKLLTNRPEQ